MLFVILREEYLNLFDRNLEGKGVLFCAAKLVEYFKHKCNWKKANQKKEWFYQPLKKIRTDLMEEHSLHVIRAAIALLVDKELLQRKQDKDDKECNGQVKTWKYRFNFEKLAELLGSPAGETETAECGSEDTGCSAETPTFNVEQHYKDQSTGSNCGSIFLSGNQRESFEKFVRDEWRRIKGQEIVSIERFLAKEEDLKNWYDRFLTSATGQAMKPDAKADATDWASHPDWEDWLQQMREGVPRFVALGTCFDNKTRRAIANWANERKLIWG